MNFLVNISSNIIYNKWRQSLASPNVNGQTNSGYDPYVMPMFDGQEEEHDHEEFSLSNGDNKIQFGGFADSNGSSGFFSTPPVIKYSREKKIITTEIGTEDEIIEQYGIKSYELDISGILVSENHINYPESKIKTLRQVFETSKEYTVTGNIFNALGIDAIYLTKFDINGIIGYQDTWEYSLKARSLKAMTFQLLP